MHMLSTVKLIPASPRSRAPETAEARCHDASLRLRAAARRDLLAGVGEQRAHPSRCGTRPPSSSVQPAEARAARRAHRALSGFAAHPGADGSDLSAGRGAGRALAPVESRTQGRPPRADPAKSDVGRERQVADRVPGYAAYDA